MKERTLQINSIYQAWNTSSFNAINTEILMNNLKMSELIAIIINWFISSILYIYIYIYLCMYTMHLDTIKINKN